MSSASKAFESLVRDKLHRILREHNDAFLHYDAAARALVPYCWQVDSDFDTIAQNTDLHSHSLQAD